MPCGTRPFFGGLAYGAGSGHRGSLSCCDWRLWSRANLGERQGRAAGLRGSTDTGPEEPGHGLERGNLASRYPAGGLVVARLPSVHARHGQQPRDQSTARCVGVDTAGAVRWPASLEELARDGLSPDDVRASTWGIVREALVLPLARRANSVSLLKGLDAGSTRSCPTQDSSSGTSRIRCSSR
jgi:hypothetical protein